MAILKVAILVVAVSEVDTKLAGFFELAAYFTIMVGFVSGADTICVYRVAVAHKYVHSLYHSHMIHTAILKKEKFVH